MAACLLGRDDDDDADDDADGKGAPWLRIGSPASAKADARGAGCEASGGKTERKTFCLRVRTLAAVVVMAIAVAPSARERHVRFTWLFACWMSSPGMQKGGAWKLRAESADEAQIAAETLQSIALPEHSECWLVLRSRLESGSSFSEAEARLSCRGSSDLVVGGHEVPRRVGWMNQKRATEEEARARSKRRLCLVGNSRLVIG